jgi:hypothetical protein
VNDLEEVNVRNVADPEQIQRAGKKVKRDREDQLNDIRSLLNTDYGRRFLWRYVTKCRVFQSVWDPGVAMHYNEGQRNVGLSMLADITEADPTALVSMMEEAKKFNWNVRFD